MQAFEIRLAEGSDTPLLVSIPHTGIFVPQSIAESFASDAIRALPMTDWHLHHLYDFLPRLGVTTILAKYSRFVCDLNRPPVDQPLYPGRFETGLVATKTFQGEEIYTQPPAAAEIAQRRQQVHEPYHAALTQQLARIVAKFGRAVLVDAHSVASQASLVHPVLEDDIYLGDRDGTSCDASLTDFLHNAFRENGLCVARNAPYKGGYITQHYGHMANVDAIQIEMCQRVYMDEADPATALELPQFDNTRQLLRKIFTGLAAHAAA
ncbi:MAG: N-formylglutamate amidohydrolase [Gammaproteobacteria bacterium]